MKIAQGKEAEWESMQAEYRSLYGDKTENGLQSFETVVQWLESEIAAGRDPLAFLVMLDLKVQAKGYETKTALPHMIQALLRVWEYAPLLEKHLTDKNLVLYFCDDPVIATRDITYEMINIHVKAFGVSPVVVPKGTPGVVEIGEQLDGMPSVAFANGQSLWVENDWIKLGTYPTEKIYD